MNVELERAVERGDVHLLQRTFDRLSSYEEAVQKLKSCSGESLLGIAFKSDQKKVYCHPHSREKVADLLFETHRKHGVPLDFVNKKGNSLLHFCVGNDLL